MDVGRFAQPTPVAQGIGAEAITGRINKTTLHVR